MKRGPRNQAMHGRYLPEPSSTLSMMTAVTDCRDIDGILASFVGTGRAQYIESLEGYLVC